MIKLSNSLNLVKIIKLRLIREWNILIIKFINIDRIKH